jgi:hypothetical protein
VVGFDVIDAIGIRMGSVSGCFLDVEGRVTFLRVTIMGHSTLGCPSFLIPAFYVTLVDSDRRKIQVRALRRLTVPEFCHPYDPLSTTPELIVELSTGHPPAAEDVADTLARLA